MSNTMTTASPFSDLEASGAYADLPTLLKLRFVAKDLQLNTRRHSRANLAGSTRTRFRGRGMEFEEVRVYHPGDDIRAIDWRVTARTHVPHTKLFREERERPTFIAADQRASMFFGSQRCFKSVLCAHLASLLAWASLHNNDRVGGVVVGNDSLQDVKPRRARQAALEFIQQINDYNHRLRSPLLREQQISLLTVLQDLRRIARPGSALYLISDFQDFDEACAQQLALLSRHCDLCLFLVSDPLEQDLPATGLLSVTDGRERLQIAASDAALHTAYQARFQKRYDALKTHSQALKIPLFSFSTVDDEISQMRRLFHRKVTAKGGLR